MFDFDTKSSLYRSNKQSRETTRFPDLVRRMFDFRQMDFESTLDQMLTLLSTEPSRVYASFNNRKRNKSSGEGRQ